LLPMQNADPANDCGRAKQLFLPELPAGAPSFRGDTSLA